MSYVILGRTIKNEYLALGTLLGTVGLAMSLSGGSKDTKPKTIDQVKESVNLNASSKEEETFIRQFIVDAEKESKH